MNTNKRYSPEVRERAPRLFFDHRVNYSSQWETIQSISGKIGCTAETLCRWVRRSEIDQGQRGGTSTSDKDRLRELERENRELKRANEILKTASAFFAHAELDRKMNTPSLYRRWIEPHTDEALLDTPVVLLAGPRQAGKTPSCVSSPSGDCTT